MTYSTSFTVSFAVAQVELSGETAERNPGISGQGARDMRVARKYEMEDQVLSSLIGCVKDLSGIDLVIKDHPDRKTVSRNAVENGCDAILSGLHHDIAVQISEVPIARLAYSESAKLTKLKQCLEAWLSAEYPSQVVDVVVHFGSLRKSFNPEKLAQEILASFVRSI